MVHVLAMLTGRRVTVVHRLTKAERQQVEDWKAGHGEEWLKYLSDPRNTLPELPAVYCGHCGRQVRPTTTMLECLECGKVTHDFCHRPHSRQKHGKKTAGYRSTTARLVAEQENRRLEESMGRLIEKEELSPPPKDDDDF